MLAAFLLAGSIAPAFLDRAELRIPAIRLPRYRKVGGLSFLRIGRFQLSWCVCRNA
jgi:hypothetical protein